MDDTLHVRLTGAAGLVLSFRDETLLVDPYYSRLGKWRVLFSKPGPDREAIKKRMDETGPVSAVVVSHTHFDHAFDVPVMEEYTRGKIIGSRSLDTLMSLNGKKGRVTVCRGGETIQASPGIRITMLPSIHGRVFFGLVPYPGEIHKKTGFPLRVRDYRVGQVFAPKIEIGNKTFLHVGSAGFDEKALAGQRCDVVFLCVPGWKRMKGYPEKILAMTGAGTVVLFHRDDFFRPLEPERVVRSIPMADVEGLVKKIRGEAPDVTVLTPGIDEDLRF